MRCVFHIFFFMKQFTSDLVFFDILFAKSLLSKVCLNRHCPQSIFCCYLPCLYMVRQAIPTFSLFKTIFLCYNNYIEFLCDMEEDMRNKKTLQELTIKDNFMFGAVMSEPENCRLLLERILEMPIERVEVSKEKTIVYNVDYKGIRLDVYAKDEKNTRYNVEMQTVQEPGLDNRMRYYHSQIDMELLLSGLSYKELPDTYVIFICDFDPYGKGKYRYTKKSLCKEVPELSMANGAHTILLSTEGKNEDEVSQELVMNSFGCISD